MSSPTVGSDTTHSVRISEILTATERVAIDDSCLAWLREKHVGRVVNADALDRDVVNDMSACATHRWALHSFPSDAHAALSPNYSQATKNKTTATFVAFPKRDDADSSQGLREKSGDIPPISAGDSHMATAAIAIHDSDSAVVFRKAMPVNTTSTGTPEPSATLSDHRTTMLSNVEEFSSVFSVFPMNGQSSFITEPSRHVLTEIFKKRQFTEMMRLGEKNDQSVLTSPGLGILQESNIPTMSLPSSRRPYFGGYIYRPGAMSSTIVPGSTRFVVFPQMQVDGCRAHSVPVSIRGTIGCTQQTLMLGSGDQLDRLPRDSLSMRKSHPLESDEVQHLGDAGTVQASVYPIRVRPASLTFTLSTMFPSRVSATSDLVNTPESAFQILRSCLSVFVDTLLMCQVDAMDIQVHRNLRETERRSISTSGGPEEIQKATLNSAGAAATFHKQDPRHSTVLRVQQRLLECDKESVSAELTRANQASREIMSPIVSGEEQHCVTTFSVIESYDSALQQRFVDFVPLIRRFGGRVWSRLLAPISPSVIPFSHRWQWEGGPSLEHSNVGSRWTLSGRVTSTGFVEWPMWNRFMFRIRNETAVVQPIALPDTLLGQSDDEETDPSGNFFGMSSHPLYWATQGPRWTPSKVRGFQDEFSNMHYVSRWFSLFSLEMHFLRGASSKSPESRAAKRRRRSNSTLSKDRRSETKSSKPRAEVHNSPAESVSSTATGSGCVTATPPPSVYPFKGVSSSGMLFANACFCDSLSRFPRASVGFSIASSTAARETINAFNAIVPSKMECSLNWFLSPGGRLFSLTPPGGDRSNGSAGNESAPMSEQQRQEPFFRLSASETFQHMKCGLTWNF